MPTPQEHEAILKENDILTQQLGAEKQHRLEAEILLSEERNLFETEKAKLREQALVHEKNMRAWHKLDMAKQKLQHENILSQSPAGISTPSSRKLPPQADGIAEEASLRSRRDENCQSANIKKALVYGAHTPASKSARKLNSDNVGPSICSKAISKEGSSSVAKSVSFSSTTKKPLGSKVSTPTTKDNMRYKRTPMRILQPRRDGHDIF